MAAGADVPEDRVGGAGRVAGDGSPAVRPCIVLLNFQLDDKYRREIAQVDPRVQVLSTYDRAGGEDRPERVEWSAAEGEALDALLAQAEVLVTFRFPVEWLQKAPNLKWVQLASAGSDAAVRSGLLDMHPQLLLTTSSGVHEVPISEHIVAMILHFSRGFNIATRNQAVHKWDRYSPDELLGKTVCLVGYGPIARRAATLLKAFGMKVIAVRASIAEQQTGFEAVDRFYPLSDLDAVLAESNYVVVAAPRTPLSEGMIGRAQIAAMKPGAVLVNISRGALVDEPALIEALRDGRIGGAALDVFAQEPLPESSPLWDMPNVLITPHLSGANPHYMRRVTTLFRDNLACYLNGDTLRNLVDKERGY